MILFLFLLFSTTHQDYISCKWYQTSAVTGRITAKHPVSIIIPTLTHIFLYVLFLSLCLIQGLLVWETGKLNQTKKPNFLVVYPNTTLHCYSFTVLSFWNQIYEDEPPQTGFAMVAIISACRVQPKTCQQKSQFKDRRQTENSSCSKNNQSLELSMVLNCK